MIVEQTVMIILTAIYVIATIVISIFNIYTSKATRDQIKESRKQFNEANRAFVNIDFEVIREALFVLKITNNGHRTAKDVHIDISDDFLDIMQDTHCRQQIELLNNSTFSIGIGQSWFVRIGTRADFDALSEKPIEITLDYHDSFSLCHEKRVIAISQYGWGLVYNSPINDISGYMKTVSESVKKISDKKNK